MFSDLFRWFIGSRRFSVDSGVRTRTAELLRSEGIMFRSVKIKNGTFCFRTFGKDVEMTEKILSLYGIKFNSSAYRGLLPAFRFVFHRPGIILGAVLFFAINMFSSHVVWNITVSGNETMTENSVIGILEECGFTYGTFIPSVDFDALHSRIMAEYPDVAWISVNVSGTIAEVQMRETKYDEREKPGIGVYSNVTASEDGRIVEYRTKGGYPVKSPGDVVKKGQLLVSGVVPLRDGGTRFSYASGEVLAEVERSVTVRAELLSEQKTYTGRKSRITRQYFSKKR